MMLSGIFKSLLSAGLLLGLSEWQSMKVKSMRMLKRRLGGAFLIFSAAQLVFLAIGFLAAAFFLGLAEVEGFVRPALVTAGILLAVAVVAGLEGWRWLTG